MSRFRLLGRHMDGTNVVGYETIDTRNNQNRTLSREQMLFLVGKGEVEGVRGRLYQDKVIIEAMDGYRNISDLPARNVNSGAFRNTPAGNRRIEVSFDTASVIGRIIEDNRFVINTGTGMSIIDKDELARAIKDNKIINARLQVYNHDGRTQHIIRMSDGSSLKELPKYSANQFATV